MRQTVPCTYTDMMLLTCSMVSAEACTAEEGCCITACAAACAAALAALATVWAAADSLLAWLMAGMLPGTLRGMEAPPAEPGAQGSPAVQAWAEHDADRRTAAGEGAAGPGLPLQSCSASAQSMKQSVQKIFCTWSGTSRSEVNLARTAM